MFQEKNIKSGNFFNNNDNDDHIPHEEETITTLKDSIISLEYRLKTIQTSLNQKMDRNQCLTLLERKANSNYVKKAIDELIAKIQEDKIRQQQVNQQIQDQQKNKINELAKKLKQINHGPIKFDQIKQNFNQKLTKKLNKTLVRPQQLYLQSNQTMFSMLIDEINQLKLYNKSIQKLIESKHKKNISLSNQVFIKLQRLQSDIESTIKYIDNMQKSGPSNFNNSSLQEKKSKKQQTFSTQNEAFQNIRLEIFAKTLQNLQKEMASKINIKDVIPLIKQNQSSLQESLFQVKQYVENNFQSTNKIMAHQSQINQQLSLSLKLGWWQSIKKDGDYSVWGKQLFNMIPQCLIFKKDQTGIKIAQQGSYLIKLYSSDEDQQQYSQQIQIGEDLYDIQRQKIVKIGSGVNLKVISTSQQVFLFIQKL